MALISAKTILTSLSLFHLTLAFFFLTNPGTVADQTLVYVLGEAMGVVCQPLPPRAPQARQAPGHKLRLANSDHLF